MQVCADVIDLNREGQLYDLEQVTGALCERWAAALFEGTVLDFVTASFTESYFTTHHLSDKKIQINLKHFFDSCDGEMSHAYEYIKKSSQTNLTTVNISLKWLSDLSFESLTVHSPFHK